MLRAIGVQRLDELYEAVPEAVRIPDLALPAMVAAGRLTLDGVRTRCERFLVEKVLRLSLIHI